MREVKRSAQVARPQGELYALINDIESYPQFIPGVTRASVESRSERQIVATLEIRRGPLHAVFTTCNELQPESRIHMKLVRGPFSVLQGEWRLTPLTASSCRVDLALRFAFANPVSGLLFEPLFKTTAASLVDAFVARALAA
ncbi:MAG TPA: type II toxin-antitoxin system RatA family toxin [Steroidobacteraceae bacterium]|nr:type II toxin-antitoxin system RatA family toxin [Steroidobacteraceae bacterium]